MILIPGAAAAYSRVASGAIRLTLRAAARFESMAINSGNRVLMAGARAAKSGSPVVPRTFCFVGNTLVVMSDAPERLHVVFDDTAISLAGFDYSLITQRRAAMAAAILGVMLMTLEFEQKRRESRRRRQIGDHLWLDETEGGAMEREAIDQFGLADRGPMKLREVQVPTPQKLIAEAIAVEKDSSHAEMDFSARVDGSGAFAQQLSNVVYSR